MKPESRHVVAPVAVRPVADVASVTGLFGGAATVATNYQLKVIILANPASQSDAIIAVGGQPAQAFRLHTEISPGVKLGEVHPDHIILSDQGIERRVDLPQENKTAGVSDTTSLRYPNVAPAAAAAAARIPDLTQINRNQRIHGVQPLPLDPSRANPAPGSLPTEPMPVTNN